MTNISILTNPRSISRRQHESLIKLLKDYKDVTIHHGGNSQDNQIRNICATFRFNEKVHPTEKSSDLFIRDGIIKSLIDRNRELVEICDIFIAVPMIVFEFEDSPIWKTIHFSIHKGKKTYVISPRGTIYSVYK